MSLIFIEFESLRAFSLMSTGSYVERHPEQLHDFSNTYLSALGVGLLTSSAVAISSNAAELPLAGADAVRLAFRLGVHVHMVSEILEPRDLTEKPATWAYVVHNVDPTVAQRELEAYNFRQQAPETGKIFVSAVCRTSITVSGPPSILGPLFNKSEYFRATKSIALPVFGGLCHAPHVYGLRDTYSIVHGGNTQLHMLKADHKPVMPIYSTSSGQQYPAIKAVEIFESIVSELLTKAIRWDSVINGLVAEAKCNAISGAILHCFGNSISLNDLSHGLEVCCANSQCLDQQLDVLGLAASSEQQQIARYRTVQTRHCWNVLPSSRRCDKHGEVLGDSRART